MTKTITDTLLLSAIAAAVAVISAGATTPLPNPAPLSTGNPQKDAYDALFIKYCASNKIPDAMLIKAQAAYESGLNANAYHDENPCNDPQFISGEGGSFSLLQINRSCQRLYGGANRYATNADGSLNAGLAFNPDYHLNYSVPLLSVTYKALLPQSKNQAVALLRMLAAWNNGPPPGGYTDPTTIYDPKGYVQQVLTWYNQFITTSTYTPPFNYNNP